jgi:hypothetical protein
MISAQILSIIAIFLSWANGITLTLGIVAFVCLQIVWCCRMGKCGLITTGVLSMIAGVCSVVVGILILAVPGSTSTLCATIESNPDQYDNTFNDDHFNPNNPDFQSHCTVGLNVFIAVAFVGGALWLIISLLLFTFACGSRYTSYILREEECREKDVVIMVQQSNNAYPKQQEATATAVTGFEEPRV